MGGAGGGAGVREGDVMMETELGRLRRRYAAGFEEGGVGPQPEVQRPLGAGKARKQMDCSPADSLILAQ